MAAIERVEVHDVFISAKTRWLFLEIGAADGMMGVGEVTCFGLEDGIRQQVAALAATLRGLDPGERAAWLQAARGQARHDLTRIVLSGFEQALLDLRSRALGLGAEELLGGRLRPRVTAYANINRGTLDRSPDGWARRARHAVVAGHVALKMAPFDDVRPDRLAEPATRARIAHGIDCVLAVRDAVGAGVAINVDCHERFTEMASLDLFRALEPAAPFWLESPILETAENLGTLRRLRGFANHLGMRLAGGEHLFALQGFRAVVERESFDVVLPDIRFCGGVQEALRIAHQVDQAGIEFSLHNPVGPVLDAISLRVATCSPALIMLEQTFEESPVQGQLATGHESRPEAGSRTAPPTPGWGIELRHAVVQANPPPRDGANDGAPGAGSLT